MVLVQLLCCMSLFVQGLLCNTKRLTPPVQLYPLMCVPEEALTHCLH
jgi:hypothetical protein